MWTILEMLKQSLILLEIINLLEEKSLPPVALQTCACLSRWEIVTLKKFKLIFSVFDH